jgi:hypothetical protein
VAAGIEPRRRAETLSLEEWAALTWAYSSAAGGPTPGPAATPSP